MYLDMKSIILLYTFFKNSVTPLWYHKKLNLINKYICSIDKSLQASCKVSEIFFKDRLFVDR